MQFYLDGYTPGDPCVADPHPALADRPSGMPDPDWVIDVRAVLQQSHRDVAVGSLPPVLLPLKARFGLVDYEKVFCPDASTDVFDLRGVDREAGCVVVVRPDQYVAHVLPLDAHDELGEFLAGMLRETGTADHGRQLPGPARAHA